VTEAAIRLQDVTLERQRRVLLRDVDFTVPRGSLTLMVGRNGVGKTSLLRAFCGLVAVRTGEIAVLGTPPAQARGRIGMMAQLRRVEAPELSGRALVMAAWRGACWGWPSFGSVAGREVARVLDLTGAAGFADRPYGVLSGGERQRLALAQALLGAPELLLLDEPLAGLDPAARVQIMEVIASVHAALGVTIVLCAHEPDLVLGYCDHVLRLAPSGVTLCRADALEAGVLEAVYAGL